MKLANRRTDLAVLLLHNVDPAWEDSDLKEAMDAVEKMHTGLEAEGHRVIDLPLRDTDLYGLLKPYDPEEYIVLNWCEEVPGIPQSDTMVAQVLEELNFVYTGSPPEVLSLSWDKAAVKRLLHRRGIATPSWRISTVSEVRGWDCFPAIIKPVFEHCSYGITRESVVLNADELSERVTFVLETFRQPALVEDFIDGREFHVTLCGNGSIEMLPPAEMDFSAFADIRDRLCTFDSKFIPGSLHYEKIEMKIPALLKPQEAAALKRTALKAYRAVGCRDYARIDLRLRDGVFIVLDINPNADLSPDTSLAYAAEAAGMNFGMIGSMLVNFAAGRRPFFSGQSKCRGVGALN